MPLCLARVHCRLGFRDGGKVPWAKVSLCCLGSSVNNGTFSCFNQMQFCKRVLWFSKSIKTDICSALTLVRSSTEHKHWKLLVGEEDIKIPRPSCACLRNAIASCHASLEQSCLVCAWGLPCVHWLRAGCSRQSEHLYLCCLPLACFTRLCLKAEVELSEWGTWSFGAEGLVNAMCLIKCVVYIPTVPSHPLYLWPDSF